MKRSPSFKSLVKKRDKMYKAYVKAEKKATELRSKVIDIEHKCISASNSIYDKFERKISFSINFSGYED